jgi:hypothetical protein
VAGVADGDEEEGSATLVDLAEFREAAELAAEDVSPETAEQQDDRPTAVLLQAHRCAGASVREGEHRRGGATREGLRPPKPDVGSLEGTRVGVVPRVLAAALRDKVLVERHYRGCRDGEAARDNERSAETAPRPTRCVLWCRHRALRILTLRVAAPG